ncbi:MAG: carboxymuconolactone decarboxylase family protein, partial [Spirochaetaceae bacterium]
MSRIEPKPIKHYPWRVRWFLRRQERKYGRVLAPSLLWGRLPNAFLGMLLSLGAFQSRRYPISAELRSLVSIRIAQCNGCFFCVDLNSYNFLRAAGAEAKATDVAGWRDSDLYSPRERAALDYAEAVTDRCASVGDAEVDALRAHFTDDQIAALTAWIAFQNMSAKFNAALGAEEYGFCRIGGG